MSTPRCGTVRAQGGVTVGELDRATAVFGLATPERRRLEHRHRGTDAGRRAGVADGHATGWRSTTSLSAEVVLASGEVVTASEETDPDLFWAIRGGGGNFGVVTSFEYRAHPVASVLGGPGAAPAGRGARAARVLPRVQRRRCPTSWAPRPRSCHAPDGSGAKLCGIAVCHCRRRRRPGRSRRRGRCGSFGSPAADMVAADALPAHEHRRRLAVPARAR